MNLAGSLIDSSHTCVPVKLLDARLTYIADTAVDLNGTDVAVTISKVEVEDFEGEDKSVVSFEGQNKMLVCNKTNLKSIAKIVGGGDGDIEDSWPGTKIVLHSAKTDYQGDYVDCIRVITPSEAVDSQAPLSETLDDEIPGF